MVCGLIPVLGVLAQHLVNGPMQAGIGRVFLTLNREKTGDVSQVFKGFGILPAAVGAYFVISFIGFLAFLGGALPGGIVAIILALPEFQAGTHFSEMGTGVYLALAASLVPGILCLMYVNLRYGLTYFILADEKVDLGVFDSIKRSGDLMTGRVLKLLWLICTFIGWYILGFLCLIVGFIGSHTYFMAAFAAFYDDIHEPEQSSPDSDV